MNLFRVAYIHIFCVHILLFVNYKFRFDLLSGLRSRKVFVINKRNGQRKILSPNKLDRLLILQIHQESRSKVKFHYHVKTYTYLG